ncbi:MAG: STAS domain-containing protein [Armatimonadetes bacterium]|nr:STAS domain-containing protein [Armatimonadota bacterium]
MIVYAKDDLVSLSGNLHRNYWLTIKAAANLLLREHPEGIIIDCVDLADISEEGAHTFVDAARDIRQSGARMIMANIPDDVREEIKSVPGLRSRVPVADSVELARASLQASALASSQADRGILVPVMYGLDYTDDIEVAAGLARAYSVPLILHYCIEVPRDVPLGTPLPELEQRGRDLLQGAAAAAEKAGVAYQTHIELVRDLSEGLLRQIDEHHATFLVLSVTQNERRSDELHVLIAKLFERGNCPLLLARTALTPEQIAAGPPMKIKMKSQRRVRV